MSSKSTIVKVSVSGSYSIVYTVEKLVGSFYTKERKVSIKINISMDFIIVYV